MTLIVKSKDIHLNTTARVQFAYKVSYEKEWNKLWKAEIRIPRNDPKRHHIKSLTWIEIWDTRENGKDEYIGLYRVNGKKDTKNRATNELVYNLQHALGTLLDKSLYRFNQVQNRYTSEVLTWLINQQEVKHWKLGKVAFKRRFSYSWENENLLSAIFSVPRLFDEQYQWTWDTTVYPFVLNLEKASNDPVARIKEGYNLVGFEVNEDPKALYNRIYPLGYGEGVNQLDIKRVNGGKPYIEDKASIAKYGLREYIWSDHRFTVEDNLFSSAGAMMNEWKEPKVTWDIRAIKLANLTGLSIDELVMGIVIRIDTEDYGTLDLRIFKEKMDDVSARPEDLILSVGGVRENLSTTQADLIHRQKINELNANGATTIFNDSYADNCDERYPAVMDLYFDEDMVYINTVELTFKTKPFRAYSKATKGGGALVGTTAAGGYSASSTQAGGGSVQGGTSQAGGATQAGTTSSAGGVHHHVVFENGRKATQSPSALFEYNDGIGNLLKLDLIGNPRTIITTAGASDAHVHNVQVNIPAHSHNFSVSFPAHSHSFTVPAHKHDITLPDHVHEIEYGIYEDNNSANSITLKVDDKIVPLDGTSVERLDILDYLSKDASGIITRGNHTIEVLPSQRARIEAKFTHEYLFKVN